MLNKKVKNKIAAPPNGVFAVAGNREKLVRIQREH